MKSGRRVAFERMLPPVLGKEIYVEFQKPAYPDPDAGFLFGCPKMCVSVAVVQCLVPCGYSVPLATWLQGILNYNYFLRTGLLHFSFNAKMGSYIFVYFCPDRIYFFESLTEISN